MEEKKYDFAKVSVRPATKREIDVLAAMHQRPVYEIVAEMVEAWKTANGGDGTFVTTNKPPVDANGMKPIQE